MGVQDKVPKKLLGPKRLVASFTSRISMAQQQQKRKPELKAVWTQRALTLPHFTKHTEETKKFRAERDHNHIRIATWNVWFDRLYQQERMEMLFQILLENGPDFICLQEVTAKLANAIKGNKALAQLYNISTSDVGRYGCMILANTEFEVEFDVVELPSRMGRELLLAKCNRLGLVVATVHLESLNNAPTRFKQLEVAKQVLEQEALSVLCGDFNFDSTQNFGDWNLSSDRQNLENDCLQSIMPNYVDAWPSLHPSSDPGLTFDGSRNPFVPQKQERMRYDRVLVSKGVELLSMSVIGSEQVNGIVPSDHFGLCVDIKITNRP